jgi:hypothetical protein
MFFWLTLYYILNRLIRCTEAELCCRTILELCLFCALLRFTGVLYCTYYVFSFLNVLRLSSLFLQFSSIRFRSVK